MGWVAVFWLGKIAYKKLKWSREKSRNIKGGSQEQNGSKMGLTLNNFFFAGELQALLDKNGIKPKRNKNKKKTWIIFANKVFEFINQIVSN